MTNISAREIRQLDEAVQDTIKALEYAEDASLTADQRHNAHELYLSKRARQAEIAGALEDRGITEEALEAAVARLRNPAYEPPGDLGSIMDDEDFWNHPLPHELALDELREPSLEGPEIGD